MSASEGEDTNSESKRDWSELEGQHKVNELFTLVLGDLQRLASQILRHDPQAAISTGTLVNEAYIKLVKHPGFQVVSEQHFKQIAARAMREYLVETARRRQTQKHGAQIMLVTLDETSAVELRSAEDVLALNAALERLKSRSPRMAQIAQDRYFGGLTIAEIMELTGASESTIHRDLKFANAWLARELRLIKSGQ